MGTFSAGPNSASLLDRETDRADRRGPGIRREGDQPELIIAAAEYGARRVATGHPERVATRQHVPEARKESDAAAVAAPQFEVEAGQRQYVGLACRTPDGARDEAQQRRCGIRGRERVRRKANGAEARRGPWPARNRPRHADLSARGPRDDYDALPRRPAP